MIIYVDGSALRPGDGTERSPFKTISENVKCRNLFPVVYEEKKSWYHMYMIKMCSERT